MAVLLENGYELLDCGDEMVLSVSRFRSCHLNENHYGRNFCSQGLAPISLLRTGPEVDLIDFTRCSHVPYVMEDKKPVYGPCYCCEKERLRCRSHKKIPLASKPETSQRSLTLHHDIRDLQVSHSQSLRSCRKENPEKNRRTSIPMPAPMQMNNELSIKIRHCPWNPSKQSANQSLTLSVVIPIDYPHVTQILSDPKQYIPLKQVLVRKPFTRVATLLSSQIEPSMLLRCAVRTRLINLCPKRLSAFYSRS